MLSTPPNTSRRPPRSFAERGALLFWLVLAPWAPRLVRAAPEDAPATPVPAPRETAADAPRAPHATPTRPRPHPAPPPPRTPAHRREARLETVVTAPARLDEPLADSSIRKEVISRRDLQDQGARTLADALGGHLGAFVSSQAYYERGAPTGIQLQGCDARRVLLLVDGRRVVGETDGLVDASTLPLHDAARVEVIKGAVSALFGADALCGVVNILSRDPPRQGVRLGWEAEYGRLHAHAARLTLGARITDRLAAEWTGGLHGRQGFDLDPGTPGTDGDEVRAVHGRLRLAWQPLDPLKINLLAGYAVERRQRVLAEAFPMMPGSSLFEAPWLLQRPEAALSAQWSFNRQDSLTLRLYDQVYLSDARRLEVQGDTRRRRITTHNYLNASLVGRVKLGRWNLLTAGAEFGSERLALRRLQTSSDRTGGIVDLRVAEVPGRTVLVEEVLLQDELSPWPWMTLVAGLRYTHHGGFGHHATPRVSLLVEPLPWLRLRASYGQGFRAPTLKDLYLQFDHSELGVPLVVRGNPDLDAETAQDVRASVELRPLRHLLAHASGFFTQYRNLIEESLPVFVEDHFEISRWNVGRARTYGLEAGLSARFLGLFHGAAGYVLLFAENQDTGAPLPHRPRHQGKLSLAFHHRRVGTRVALWGTVQSALVMESPVCGGDPVTTPSYPLLHATVEQRVWKGIHLTLRAQNLTNTVRAGSALCDLRPQPGWMLYGGVRGEITVP